MSDPQYGTQTVRFVETAQVAVTDEIDQFRVCQQVGDKNPTEISNAFSFPAASGLAVGDHPADYDDEQKATGTLAVFGVTQQRLRAVPADTRASEQNSGDNLRLVPVATSGNLLVEVDTATDSQVAVGAALTINAKGQASTAPAASATAYASVFATVNGTVPTIRSLVNLGPKKYALVSFT